MTIKNHLLKLIESEVWANNLLAETIEKSNQSDERTLLLFSHLLSSYSMWLSRVKATEITTALFQERTLAERKTLMQQVFSEWKNYLKNATEEELNRIVYFVFSLDGTKRKLSVTDAVLHLVTHSNYHRGQAIARLKDKTDVLPLTSYIAFAMEKDE